MPTQGEIIKELSEKLERQLIIDDLTKIQTMEELKEYIEVLLPYIYEGRCNRIIKEEKTERTLDFMRRRYYNKKQIYRFYMNGGVYDG